MFCVKCGHQNEEGHAFCAICGTRLKTAVQTQPVVPQNSAVDATESIHTQPIPGEPVDTNELYPSVNQPVVSNQAPALKLKQKKKSKLPLMITAVLVLIIGGTATAIFGVSAMNTRKYDEMIDTGNKYLEELKYDEAVETFLGAIDIKPKREEAYVGAAKGYIGLDEPEKAKDILEQGLENVEEPGEEFTDLCYDLGVVDEGREEQPSTTQLEKTKILSPESAVSIFLENKDVWMLYPDYEPLQGYYYGFLDLDFDGVLELLSISNDGSGRYSSNQYYKINVSDYSVKEIASNELDLGDGFSYDFTYLKEFPKILLDKKNGVYRYFCADYLRISTNEYACDEGTLVFENGVLNAEVLFSEYTYPADNNDGSSSTVIYAYYENGNRIEVNSELYKNKHSSFLIEYENANLSWEYIDGKELENAAETGQMGLLLDAYLSFSYVGFSFDNYETFTPLE